MNDSPFHLVPEKTLRSSSELAGDVTNWFIVFILTAFFVVFLIPYVIIALTAGFNLEILLIFIGLSIFIGGGVLLLGVLFVGGIKHIPTFSWKDAATFKYSFFRVD